MLSEREKKVVEDYLEQPKIAKSISFWLQREEIEKKYSDAIFPLPNQSLEEYIEQIIKVLPYSMIKSGYIKECISYLCKNKEYYFVSIVNEL